MGDLMFALPCKELFHSSLLKYMAKGLFVVCGNDLIYINAYSSYVRVRLSDKQYLTKNEYLSNL